MTKYRLKNNSLAEPFHGYRYQSRDNQQELIDAFPEGTIRMVKPSGTENLMLVDRLGDPYWIRPNNYVFSLPGLPGLLATLSAENFEHNYEEV